MPNDVEDLDVQRSSEEEEEEPFCGVREYKAVSKVRSMREAYQLLEDGSAAKIGWKLVTMADVVLC